MISFFSPPPYHTNVTNIKKVLKFFIRVTPYFFSLNNAVLFCTIQYRTAKEQETER